MEYPSQLQLIDEMNQTAINGHQWTHRIHDVDDANQLLETTIRLMSIAIGDFDVTNELHMIHAQRKALTLVEKSLAETPDSSICMMLPDTLSESRIVNQILARMAAQWLTNAADDEARTHLQAIHQRIADAETT